jgi:hypothetical protein
MATVYGRQASARCAQRPPFLGERQSERVAVRGIVVDAEYAMPRHCQGIAGARASQREPRGGSVPPSASVFMFSSARVNI